MNTLRPLAEQLSVPSAAYTLLIVAGLIGIAVAILGIVPLIKVNVGGVVTVVPLINLKKWQIIIFGVIGVVLLLLLGLILTSPKVIQAIVCHPFTIIDPKGG